MTEFWEDYFSEPKNKGEMYDLDLPFSTIGDPLVDRWEKQVRSGQVPDLLEGMDDEEAKDLIDWSRKAYKRKVQRGMISPDLNNNTNSVSDEIESLLGDNDSFEEEF